MKYFNLRLTKISRRSKFRFIVFILCSVCYLSLPQLLFSSIPVTPPDKEWHDADFNYAAQNDRNLLLFKEEIIILHWTSWWGNHEDVRVLNNETCSALKNGTVQQTGTSAVFNLPCKISFDRRYLQTSDALVFHSFDLQRNKLPEVHERTEEQLWVYVQQESPIYTKLLLQNYRNIFNWTMTYRRDSDVYYPYAHIVPSSSLQINGTEKWSTMLQSKNRLVAWIVRDCESHSKREYFVHELKKYISVDIYGWCGVDCPDMDGDCYSHVQSTHKFYLSFENSLCTDYVTEKFFNGLKSDMVPVTYGGTSEKDYAEIAPKNSYIDARSFKSPKKLADYLLYLDGNDEEYLKYFEWKKMFQVAPPSLGWCNLCQRVFEHLNENRVEPKRRKWYGDLYGWWNFNASYITSDNALLPTSKMNEEYEASSDRDAHSICSAPDKQFTDIGNDKIDLEPSWLNGRLLLKWMGQMKE